MCGTDSRVARELAGVWFVMLIFTLLFASVALMLFLVPFLLTGFLELRSPAGISVYR